MKKFKWEKIGLIFSPKKRFNWMYSHCQLPVADHLGGDEYRVYFAARSHKQISQIGSVDLNITNPKEVYNISSKPILNNGELGHFDEYGVYPSSIINLNNKKYLYYIGWIRGYESPMFYASVGLAISEDGGKSFYKYSNVPILDKSKYDPCLVTSPNVFVDEGLFRMTYVSGIGWNRINGKLKSKYHIKIAYSNDGLNWIREGEVAIDFKNKKESNIARSSVIKHENKYYMWFSYVDNHHNYRMGFASSLNFSNWKRDDNSNIIQLSKTGFDNEMTCYPNVFRHKNKLYMFYNGNNFGEEGFGLAVCSLT